MKHHTIIEDTIGFIGNIEGFRVYFSMSIDSLTTFTGNSFFRPVYLYGKVFGYVGSHSMLNWSNMPAIEPEKVLDIVKEFI